MHFPIIEICSDEEQFGQSIYDDPVLNYRTDYYGEEYSEEERKEALNDVRDYFSGLAEVDPVEGVLRVHDADTIRKTLVDYHEKLLERLSETDYSQRGLYAMFFDLREAGNNYKGSDMLFFYDGYGYTSMQFIEDLVFHAGETLYIGTIYDAHI